MSPTNSTLLTALHDNSSFCQMLSPNQTTSYLQPALSLQQSQSQSTQQLYQLSQYNHMIQAPGTTKSVTVLAEKLKKLLKQIKYPCNIRSKE